MKKIVSILLVTLLLFNALGFYGLLQGIRYKTTRDLVQRLDKDLYQDEETITLKVPITLPYPSDENEYQRIDGEIEHNGEFYRLVKQKYQSDTLFLVCIKDRQSKRIKQALTDYVKTFTDNPADAKQTGKSLITFIKDFLPTSTRIMNDAGGWNYTVTLKSTPQFFYNRSLVVFTPPPQV